MKKQEVIKGLEGLQKWLSGDSFNLLSQAIQYLHQEPIGREELKREIAHILYKPFGANRDTKNVIEDILALLPQQVMIEDKIKITLRDLNSGNDDNFNISMYEIDRITYVLSSHIPAGKEEIVSDKMSSADEFKCHKPLPEKTCLNCGDQCGNNSAGDGCNDWQPKLQEVKVIEPLNRNQFPSIHKRGLRAVAEILDKILDKQAEIINHLTQDKG